MNFKNVIFTNGASESQAKTIISIFKSRKELGFRENEILNDITTIEKNNDVPEGYIIYGFYDSNGNGFEGGKTPNGYSITC